MRRLLLLRHAVTEHTGHKLSGWLPGLHLSEEGRGQARALAERLRGLPIDVLYASPLERCQETALALAAERALEVRTLAEIGEVRYGDWSGRGLAELAKEKLWATVQVVPSAARFPGGESLYEMQVRSVTAVERLRAEHPGQAVAVCTHADVIRALVAHYLGLHLDLYQRLAVAPASLTAIGFGFTPVLERLNDTGGVADLAARPEEAKAAAARDGGRDGEAAGAAEGGRDGRP